MITEELCPHLGLCLRPARGVQRKRLAQIQHLFANFAQQRCLGPVEERFGVKIEVHDASSPGELLAIRFQLRGSQLERRRLGAPIADAASSGSALLPGSLAKLQTSMWARTSDRSRRALQLSSMRNSSRIVSRRGPPMRAAGKAAGRCVPDGTLSAGFQAF